ncbi:MAG: hypothetical protein LBJ92_01905 [Holosporales bacterium]|jgi:hypothetical protein|nr:hypothetical protein [Holosporales bacterium]
MSKFGKYAAAVALGLSSMVGESGAVILGGRSLMQELQESLEDTWAGWTNGRH